MDLKNIKTKDLIKELESENKLYQENKVCLCRTKYSNDDDLKVLGRVLVLDELGDLS